MRLLFLGTLSLVLLTISLFSISENTAYGEKEIIANSYGIENSTILELKNSRGNNVEISEVRIWLGSDNSFQSFKTEKGWIGKNTPQGVIVFETKDFVGPGETVKFGIKTVTEKPGINWKALDSNGNLIKTAKTVTTSEIGDGVDAPQINQPKSVALKDESNFRLIPTKLSPGSDFRVVGENFVPNQSLNLYIDNKLMKSFSTNNDGHFLISSTVPTETSADRTEFLVTDTSGAEKQISLRLIDSAKRTIVKTLELVFDDIPPTVKRGDSITLTGTATPDTTLTIKSQQQNLGVFSINTITSDSNGRWMFENLFSPELGLESVSIVVSDGKTEIIRDIELVSPEKIRINSEELRYEPGDLISFSGNAIANSDMLISLEDPKGTEVYSEIISVDSSGVVNFDIPTDNSSMKGTYILTANQGSDESIAVVGIGEDPVEIIIVKTSKLNFGSNETIPVTIQGTPGATISLIIIDEASKEKLSDTVVLGADGFIIYEINAQDLSSGAFTVEVRHGKARGNTVFTIGLVQGSGPIQVQTTRDEYNPGEQILVMGKTGKSSLMTISLLDPEENLIKKIETFTNKEGSFRSEKFRIPNDPIIGEWTIKAKSGGNIAEHKFKVAEALEGIIVLVDRESLTYSLGEIVDIAGAGAYESGAVVIEFLDSDGNEVGQKLTIYATNSGEYRTSWIIPNNIEPGNIEIQVNDPQSSSSITITVN